MFLRRKSAAANKKMKGKEMTKDTPAIKDVAPAPSVATSTTTTTTTTTTEQDPWSEENFVGMAQLYKLNEEQQDKMHELQGRLADVDHWKNDPYEVIRFLKECKYNIKSAEDKFRKMVFWRMENNIDNFLETYGEPHPLLDYFPSVVLRGVDKEGDPIFLERAGVFDAFGYYKEFGTQAMVDYMIYRREKDITRYPHGAGPSNWQRDYYEPKYGRRVGQYTAIMDMEGLNRNHMRAGLLPLLNQMARITQDHYAGVAKRIIVLRAPAIFKMFWSLVKHFFDPCIRELVTFTTSADYLQVLDQYIDRQVLPPELCPEHGVGTYMPGFENVHLQGVVLTPELKKLCSGKRDSNMTDATECMTDFSMSLGCDLDDSSERLTVTPAVKAVSGSLLGGGSFNGCGGIYLK